MNKSFLSMLFAAALVVVSGLACGDLGNSNKSGEQPSNSGKPSVEDKAKTSDKPAKLDSYSIKGIKFAYFKIPSGLKKEELIELAQKLHDQEPDHRDQGHDPDGVAPLEPERLDRMDQLPEGSTTRPAALEAASAPAPVGLTL